LGLQAFQRPVTSAWIRGTWLHPSPIPICRSRTPVWRFRFIEKPESVTQFGLRRAQQSVQLREQALPGASELLIPALDDSLTVSFPADYRLMLRLGGQLTNQPLNQQRELLHRGSDGVRGYLEAEAWRPNAIKEPSRCRHDLDVVRSKLFNVFAFVDAATPMHCHPGRTA